MTARLQPELTADAQVAKTFVWRCEYNAMPLIDLGTRLGLVKAFADKPGATSRSAPAKPCRSRAARRTEGGSTQR